MHSISNYSREDLAFASEVETEETLAVRKVLHQFITANYAKYTLYQLGVMLNVSPAFIQDQLTPQQVKRCGSKAIPTIVIVRDIDKWEEDKAKWQL